MVILKNTTMRPGNWFVIHVIFIGGSWISGKLVGELVFELSHDYVFPPGSFQRTGLMAGWFGAAATCCVVQWMPSVSVSFSVSIKYATLAILIGLLVTLVAPAVPVVLRESGIGGFPDTLQTGRRHLYCMSIPASAGIGWLVGCVAFCRLAATQRPQNTPN
jgi:hypothetical protein